MNTLDPSTTIGPEQAAPPAPVAKFNILTALAPGDYLIVGLLALLFFPMFKEMYEIWTLPEAPQSYGLLIIPASAILAFMLRARFESLTPTPDRRGLVITGVGIVLAVFGTLAAAATISAVGFIFVVLGVTLARYGGAITRKLWFPIAYLISMIPMPSEVLNLTTFPLQRLSIRMAGMMLKPFGDVKVEGTQLTFGGFGLNVIAPCSGLTIVLPLLVLAAFYLFIIVAPNWKRALLAFIIFPLAMVVNAVRVALIAVVGESMGQHAADSFHDYSGLITVALGFVALMLIAREMKCDQIHDDIVL